MSCKLTRPRTYPVCPIREVPTPKEYDFESAVPIRPSFLEDTEVVRAPQVSLLKQKAFDYISAVPVRPGFNTAPPLPRQTAEVIEAPVKPTFKLDKETMGELLGEEIPDPNDTAWLAERARRLAAGETEAQLTAFPPFGRQQKMLKKIQRSLTTAARMSSARTNTELTKIIQEIKDGRAETEQGFTEIIVDLQNIIQAGNANNAQLVAAVKALNLPAAQNILPFTFYEYKGYIANKNVINADLIRRQDEPDMKLPLILRPLGELKGRDYAYGEDGLPITLNEMEGKLRANDILRNGFPGGLGVGRDPNAPILGIELNSRRIISLAEVPLVPGATANPTLIPPRPPTPSPPTTPNITPPPSP